MRLQEEARMKELAMELDKIKQEKDEEDLEQANQQKAQSGGRRQSRFAISTVDDNTAGTQMIPDSALLSPNMTWTNNGASRKLKGILKKQGEGSNTVHGPSGSQFSPVASPYQTVSGSG